MTLLDSPTAQRVVDALRAAVRGVVLRPDDPGYEEARSVYNAIHDRRPAVIVQAVAVADVMATVRLAAENDLALAVRGGAHSIAGFSTCDGGIVLDLGSMNGVRVDPELRTARAEPGANWGDFNHATHAFGLATTGGIVSTTGISGLTLGGGMGHLARRCGLTCDNLLSADVVTADGRFLTCSQERYPDLFWALRGGGGNFGVVTSFEYRLHPVSDILGGPTFYPLDPEVVRAYLDLVTGSPGELNLILAFVKAPPVPFVPEPWHGRPVCAVQTCWSGPASDDDRIRARLAELGTVVGQYVDRMPYPVINTLFDELLPAGLRHYWKGCFNDTLSGDAIDAHLRFAETLPSPETATLVFPIDGASRRVPAEDTAFAYRDANFSVGLGATWHSAADDEANIAWTRSYYETVRPSAMEGGYVNFAAHDDAGRAAANYRQNHARLMDVKRRFDPANLFRLNHNIDPEGTDAH